MYLNLKRIEVNMNIPPNSNIIQQQQQQQAKTLSINDLIKTVEDKMKVFKY